MEINGLNAEIHMPNAPSGDGVHRLPPAHRLIPAMVDEYPACPSNWMHGSALASSYFVPLKPGKHMWLDFNGNANHPNDVAVVLSIQGINPITGQQTKELRLEQYREKCPVHDHPFGPERFCEKCEYAWPAQNYMTTASMPKGMFWIDGFRSEKGEVRGFLITEEAVRGVASQLIGEDRVFAIGIAFYLSKTAKPLPPEPPASYAWPSIYHDGNSYKKLTKRSIKTHQFIPPNISGGDVWVSTTNNGGWIDGGDGGGGGNFGFSSDTLIGSSGFGGGGGGGGNVTTSFGGGGGGGGDVSSGFLRSASFNAGGNATASSLTASANGQTAAINAANIEQVNDITKLEIGAGARITQDLAPIDNHELSYYQDAPTGMIYVNYCTEADYNRIIGAGRKSLSRSFLAGVKTGN